jgi:hypothetical protein
MCRPNRFFFFLSLAFYSPPLFFFFTSLCPVLTLSASIKILRFLFEPFHDFWLPFTVQYIYVEPFFFLLFFYPFRCCSIGSCFASYCFIFTASARSSCIEKKGRKKTSVVVKRQSMRLCSSCRGSIARVDTYRYKST